MSQNDVRHVGPGAFDNGVQLRVIDDKKIRAAWISLDQEFAVPCAESLSNHLAWLGMYRGFAAARAYAGTSDALAAKVINVMENNQVRLVWRTPMLDIAARAAHGGGSSKKQEACHTI